MSITLIGKHEKDKRACRDAYVEDDWLKSTHWQYCPHCGAKMDGKESENG